jgi:two-component system response regulator RegA
MTGSAAANARSVLVVDDDGTFRTVLARALRTRGYDVRTAASYDEALAQVLAEAPRFAVLDLQMPGRSGLELVRAIKRESPATVVLVLTGDRSTESMASAMKDGASRYLSKPIDPDDLVAALVAEGGPRGR